MTTVLPDGVNLTAQVVGDKVDFRYVERFTSSSYLIDGEQVPRNALLSNTLRLLRQGFAALPEISVSLVGDDSIEARGLVRRSKFGNMMVMEFLGWSSIGDMKLRDFFLSLGKTS